MQLPDIASIDRTHVNEPLDDGEERVPMFDVELEGVLSVEETKPLVPYLPACSKQAELHLHILETVKASSLLGMSYVWAVPIAGEERVLLGGNQCVNYVA